MDAFKEKEALDSFSVIVDTREQPTRRAQERYQSIGVDVRRAKLNYGDYTYNFKIDGEWFYNESLPINPKTCIERKMSADELATCFTSDRDRFEREMLRASEQNARMYLLVEGTTWESIMAHQYRSWFAPNAYIASLTAWQARYDLRLIMCKPNTSGRLIAEILKRELKEQIERGEFDG